MIRSSQKFYQRPFRTFVAMVLSILLFGIGGFCQTVSPQSIVEKVQSRLNEIDDYSVTAKTVVEIPNLRIPDKTIHVFYKKPDRVSVKTSGFAIVPKFGFLPSVSSVITDDVDIRLQNTVTEDGQTMYVLVIKPRELKVNVVTTIWVDTQRWTLEKVLIEAKDFGESVIIFSYVDIDGVWLPESTTVFLKMKQGIPDMQRPSVEYPVGFMAFNNQPKNIQGKVTVTFRDYKVNRGIDDSVFEE
jgi:outer membrane lipoprotein-sorting protein